MGLRFTLLSLFTGKAYVCHSNGCQKLHSQLNGCFVCLFFFRNCFTRYKIWIQNFCFVIFTQITQLVTSGWLECLAIKSLITINCFFFLSCGSVKHGWEKKWIVLDDQKLQLFDKENMGGKEEVSSYFVLLTLIKKFILMEFFFLFQKTHLHLRSCTCVVKTVTWLFTPPSCHQNWWVPPPPICLTSWGWSHDRDAGPFKTCTY